MRQTTGRTLFEKYAIDSSFILDLLLPAPLGKYPVSTKPFDKIWGRIERLMLTKTIVSSVEIYKELERGNEVLFNMYIKKHRNSFVDIDDGQLAIVRPIVNKYPQFTEKGLGNGGSAADPFLIGLAKAHNLTVLTSENLVVGVEKRTRRPPQMPNVCKELNIKFLNVPQFCEEIGIK